MLKAIIVGWALSLLSILALLLVAALTGWHDDFIAGGVSGTFLFGAVAYRLGYDRGRLPAPTID